MAVLEGNQQYDFPDTNVRRARIANCCIRLPTRSRQERSNWVSLLLDVEGFYRDMSAKGMLFSMPPKKQDFGGVLAQFIDSEGALSCAIFS